MGAFDGAKLVLKASGRVDVENTRSARLCVYALHSRMAYNEASGVVRAAWVHNYLAEALRIAAGESSLLAQREHLLAVIQHCRSLVGALMAISGVR